jgi:hypothetical protein
MQVGSVEEEFILNLRKLPVEVGEARLVTLG